MLPAPKARKAHRAQPEPVLKAPRDHREARDQPGLLEARDHRDHRGFREARDHREAPGAQAHKAHKAHRVQPEARALKAPKVRRVLREAQVLKAHKGQRALPVLKELPGLPVSKSIRLRQWIRLSCGLTLVILGTWCYLWVVLRVRLW
jgi:hypothetical protein